MLTSQTVKKLFIGAALATLLPVVVARMVHTHTAATHASNAYTTGAASGLTPSPLHGMIACPTANITDCEKLKLWWPE